MSLPTARVKRRKTTNKQDDNDQTTIIDALQIVQNQTILNATQMNTNLQQLSNEINEIYNYDGNSQSVKEWRKDLRLLATNIDVTIQKYKECRVKNTLAEEGDQIKNNSWCTQLDAYVYDPHVRGKATFYDKCKCTNDRCPRSEDDGAIFPATLRPLGDEALIVLLGNKEIMKEDSLLRMRNNYLCAKVDNQIRQLHVHFKSENTFLNKGFPSFIAEEEDDDEDISEEEDDTMQGAVNVSLSDNEEEDGSSDEEETHLRDEETPGQVLDEEAINDDIADSDVEAMMDSAVAPPGYEGYHVSLSSGSADENESPDEEDEEEESEDEEEEEEEEEGDGFLDANRVEIDDTIPERVEELLSKLSNEDLMQHVAAYNIDLRKDIADTTAFIGNLEQRWRFTPNEFYLYVANNLANRRLSKSIQDLPGKVDIVFDPLQEMENRFLCEKLEGLFILLMRAVFDKELFDDQYAELFEEEPISKFRFFFEFPGFL